MTAELLLELAELDDVAVSKEDEHLLVTCWGHDGADTIELEDVHERIAEAGCRVQKTTGNFDAGEISLEVVER
ncbi:hypothetical protein [Natrinema pallidum]|uniref:hypothetical protein n=1 Tax=Natrinema pallidum TaxID=69527 RepID=UPI0037516E21